MKSRADNLILVEPKPVRWTKEHYYEMGKLGWFRDRRVELIEGEVIAMPPIGDEHAFAVRLVDAAIRHAFGSKFTYSVQSPIDLGDSQPQPDVAVLRGKLREHKTHPKTAVLVVEVSDTTLLLDRTRKARVYAAAKISDYWIVNLEERVLEVRRNPHRDAKSPTGWRYDEPMILQSCDTIAPLAFPRKKIKVADLLP